MKLTREQTIENHRKMWNWIAACSTNNYKKAAKLARIIANLPENDHIADSGKTIGKKEQDNEKKI